MRLIDADAIRKVYAPIAPVLVGDDVHYEWIAFIEDIDELPTVDIPTVVTSTIDAIPIEWIMNYAFNGKTRRPISITLMVSEWRREHETN